MSCCAFDPDLKYTDLESKEERRINISEALALLNLRRSRDAKGMSGTAFKTKLEDQYKFMEEVCNFDISQIYPHMPSFTINDLINREIELFTKKSIDDFLRENPEK